MDGELLRAYEILTRAIVPEDVFGPIQPGSAEPPERAIRSAFHALARVCHPDRFADVGRGAPPPLHNEPDAHEVALEAFKLLTLFHQRAEAKLARGTYGDRNAEVVAEGEAEIRTSTHTYRVSTKPFVEGDLALLYRGTCVGADAPEGHVVAKVARDPRDNDLLRNEIRVLRRLSHAPSAQAKHLPVLLDVFKSDDRQGLVLRQIDALDGTSLRERLAAGVPAIHACWILQRLLSTLGYVHGKGVVHGNIEPSHVLVRPRDHNVFLIDWSYAVVDPVRTGERFRTLNEVYSAPEVEARKPPTPATDLFSVGKTLIYLLGGDPEQGTFPTTVPLPLSRLLTFLTLASHKGRAQSAWHMHKEVERVRQELSGPRPRPFVELLV